MSSYDPIIQEAVRLALGSTVSIDQLGLNEPITHEHLVQIAVRVTHLCNGEPSARIMKQLQTLFVSAANITTVRIKTPSARITVARANLLKVLQAYEDQFWARALSDDRPTPALIIFSAIRYGGLLYKPFLDDFSQKLALPINHRSGYYWYELHDSRKDTTEHWQPDIITLALITRSLKSKSPPISANPAEGAGWYPYLAEEGFDRLSATQLLEACSVALSLQIPSGLIDCCWGISDTRSLDRGPFLRLLTGMSPPLAEPVNSLSASAAYPAPSARTEQRLPSSSNNDRLLMREAGRPLRHRTGTRKTTKEAICSIIERYRDSCTPAALLLCEWSAFRLTERNHWGNRFSPSSAYTRRGILRHLVCQQFGNRNPLRASGSQLSDDYAEIIDCADSHRQRVDLAKNLRDFHDFLEQRYDVEPLLDDGPWQWLKANSTEVDAKVVWPREYLAAREYLIKLCQTTESDELKWRWRSCVVALMLGYRCGMRRSEILYLHKEGVVGSEKTEVIVRPTEDYELKSTSSHRRIPVHALLDTKERSILNKWLHLTAHAKYLLPSYADPNCCQETTYLFDPIQSLLKQATGDPSARFHHLRHSVATINFLRWMNPGLKGHLAEMIVEADIDVDKQKQVILGSGEKSQQRVLHALSALLGHSGPQMTLAHYIHSSGILAHLYCNSKLPEMTQEKAGQLLGITDRQIRKHVANQGLSGWPLIEAITQKRIKQQADVTLEGWTTVKSEDLLLSIQGLPLQQDEAIRLWQALCLHTHQGVTPNRAAERFSVSEESLLTVIKRAKKMMSIKHDKRSHKTFRHHLPAWKALDSPPLFFPLPKKHRDYKWVYEMVANYRALSDTDRARVNEAIRYFINNGKAWLGDIPFETKGELEKFLQLFDLLKLNPCVDGTLHPAYRLVLRHKGVNADKRKSAWGYWLGTKGIMENFKFNRIKVSHSAEHGILSLRTISRKPKNHIDGARRQGAWGFRLGLYVLAVTTDALRE